MLSLNLGFSHVCSHSEQYFGYKLGVTLFEARTFFSLKPYLLLNSGLSFFSEETLCLETFSLWMSGPDLMLTSSCIGAAINSGWHSDGSGTRLSLDQFPL